MFLCLASSVLAFIWSYIKFAFLNYKKSKDSVFRFYAGNRFLLF